MFNVYQLAFKYNLVYIFIYIYKIIYSDYAVGRVFCLIESEAISGFLLISIHRNIKNVNGQLLNGLLHAHKYTYTHTHPHLHQPTQTPTHTSPTPTPTYTHTHLHPHLHPPTVPHLHPPTVSHLHPPTRYSPSASCGA